MNSKQLARRHFLQLTAATTASTFLGIYSPIESTKENVESNPAQACGEVDCPAWCECSNGVCQPTSIQINAVRLRTLDGRYLQAESGGGQLGFRTSLLRATAVVPQQWETFLLASPSHYPLASGDPITR